MTVTTSRDRLNAMLAELRERQDHIAKALADRLNDASSERAVKMDEEISLQGQAALVSREIASVERALVRVEEGTYGLCVRCGGDVAVKRLEARPEAALCIECARNEQ